MDALGPAGVVPVHQALTEALRGVGLRVLLAVAPGVPLALQPVRGEVSGDAVHGVPIQTLAVSQMVDKCPTVLDSVSGGSPGAGRRDHHDRDENKCEYENV